MSPSLTCAQTEFKRRSYVLLRVRLLKFRFPLAFYQVKQKWSLALRVLPVANFPALGTAGLNPPTLEVSLHLTTTACFPALATRCMFSRACHLLNVSPRLHPLHVFPRLLSVADFPALVISCIYCALSTSCTFSRVLHRFQYFASSPDWFALCIEKVNPLTL